MSSINLQFYFLLIILFFMISIINSQFLTTISFRKSSFVIKFTNKEMSDVDFPFTHSRISKILNIFCKILFNHYL